MTIFGSDKWRVLRVRHVLAVLNLLSKHTWVWRHQFMDNWCLFDFEKQTEVPKKFCQDHDGGMSMHAVVAWLCSVGTGLDDFDITAMLSSTGMKEPMRHVHFGCNAEAAEIDVDRVLETLNAYPRNEAASLQYGLLLRCDPEKLPSWIEPLVYKDEDGDNCERFGVLEVFNSALALISRKERLEVIKTGQYDGGHEVIEGFRYRAETAG